MTNRAVRRFAARRDDNEDPIVRALRHEGCFVTQMSEGGLPDLLVWTPFLDRWVILEVKRPKKKLRPKQEAFFELHVAARTLGFLHRVENETEALVAVGARPATSHQDCRNCDGDGFVTEHDKPRQRFRPVCSGFAPLGADLPLTPRSS